MSQVHLVKSSQEAFTRQLWWLDESPSYQIWLAIDHSTNLSLAISKLDISQVFMASLCSSGCLPGKAASVISFFSSFFPFFSCGQLDLPLRNLCDYLIITWLFKALCWILERWMCSLHQPSLFIMSVFATLCECDINLRCVSMRLCLDIKDTEKQCEALNHNGIDGQ